MGPTAGADGWERPTDWEGRRTDNWDQWLTTGTDNSARADLKYVDDLPQTENAHERIMDAIMKTLINYKPHVAKHWVFCGVCVWTSVGS